MIIKKRDRNYLQIAKETELGQALRGGSGADLVRVQWVQLNSQIWGKKKKKRATREVKKIHTKIRRLVYSVKTHLV